jgi:hypothetical protein
MTRANMLLSLVALALFTSVLVWRFTINKSLSSEVAASVAGQVSSVMLCALVADKMPTSCVPLDKGQADQAINALRVGSTAETPSHGIRKSEHLFKIVNTTPNDSFTKCFVLVEYVGFERDLYVLPVLTGKDCSGDTFKYAPGSVRIRNFLHSEKQ